MLIFLLLLSVVYPIKGIKAIGEGGEGPNNFALFTLNPPAFTSITGSNFGHFKRLITKFTQHQEGKNVFTSDILSIRLAVN